MSHLPTIYLEEACREAAKQARLRYVKDTTPGITRRHKGDGFIYFAPNNDRITADAVITRINALAIPPAYRDVWICPLENGHLQATGRDARARKQYRYHPKWHEVRNLTKFSQMRAFAEALPTIRKRLEKHLALPGLPREKVLASVVRLMDDCNMRVGNDQYAKENGTYGLTTIRKKHVEVSGDTIRFEFTGKSGKLWQRDLTDRRIASIVKKCEEIPGQELFKFIGEDGSKHDVTSDQVNDYLQEISGLPFTAKDFRTWNATALALTTLGALEPQETKRDHTAQLTAAIKQIAAEMGHTPAICRQCYIYPAVLTQYDEGALFDWFQAHRRLDDQRRVLAFLADN